MPSSTIENYLKQILIVSPNGTSDLVAMGRLARVMNITPGTATTMIKAMADAGLVNYQPRKGVKLTAQGRKLALHVLRRHRLIELFLVQTLGLDWTEVHPEAEVLEHVISDRVLNRIDALLGHPEVDPHGDPIPTAEGRLRATPSLCLWDAETGQIARVSRVMDQSEAFLRYLTANDVRPGTALLVKSREVVAETMSVRLMNGTKLTLAASAAKKIVVTPGQKRG